MRSRGNSGHRLPKRSAPHARFCRGCLKGCAAIRVAPLLAMLVVGYLAARATATALTSDELALLLADDAEPNRVASDDDSV